MTNEELFAMCIGFVMGIVFTILAITIPILITSK